MHSNDPMSAEELNPHQLIPNRALKQAIDDFNMGLEFDKSMATDEDTLEGKCCLIYTYIVHFNF